MDNKNYFKNNINLSHFECCVYFYIDLKTVNNFKTQKWINHKCVKISIHKAVLTNVMFNKNLTTAQKH